MLLYGTTGLLTANYADYSAGFLTKPELGLAISASYLAAMLSSLIAGRTSINSKNIVGIGIILAAAGIFLSVKTAFTGFLPYRSRRRHCSRRADYSRFQDQLQRFCNGAF